MKRPLIYILALLGLCAGFVSCNPEELINDTDTPRHQVENLKCVAEDEEVTLSWTIPEGWEPTDYLIIYSDDASVTQRVYTKGATSYTITGLINDFGYTFSVQAVYGDVVSHVVEVSGKPMNSRIAVKSINATPSPESAQSQYIELTWDKPSDLVLGYTLTYFPEMNPTDVKTVELGKDAVSYMIEGIIRDDNYEISLVAKYPKGEASPAQEKVWFKRAYYVSQTTGAIGQTITFTFNREAYQDATDVKWQLPGGVVETGDVVNWEISATGQKEVLLSATVNGKTITWPAIELKLREWVINYSNWDMADGKAWTGFRGAYPVFSPDGKTVYALAVMNFTALNAFDVETGSLKWTYFPEVVHAGYNAPTVNPVNGDIYFGTATAGDFYCVSDKGQLRWSYPTKAKMGSSASPAVSADGKTVFLCDQGGNAAALAADTGAELWTKALGKAGAGVLVYNDEVVIAVKSPTSSVYFLNASNGSELARISIEVAKNGPTEKTGWAVADDKKTAYIPLSGGNANEGGSGMAAIDLEKRTLLKAAVYAGNDVYAPVVASNGYVVAGDKFGNVIALDPMTLEVKWKIVPGGAEPVLSSMNYSHVSANANCEVFIANGKKGAGHKTYVINAADGSIKSSFSLSDQTGSYCMSGTNFHNGVVYFLSASDSINGEFYAKYVGGEDKFWGGPGGDICGSSCVQSPLFK